MHESRHPWSANAKPGSGLARDSESVTRIGSRWVVLLARTSATVFLRLYFGLVGYGPCLLLIAPGKDRTSHEQATFLVFHRFSKFEFRRIRIQQFHPLLADFNLKRQTDALSFNVPIVWSCNECRAPDQLQTWWVNWRSTKTLTVTLPDSDAVSDHRD